jgi:hypothetical protein
VKKSILAASFLLSINLAASSTVMADPSFMAVSFTCPTTVATDEQALVNDGKQITGKGIETVGDKQEAPPLFIYDIPSGANIPSDLSSYASSGTNFDSATGRVSCEYTSLNGDSFAVDYVASINNAAIEKQTNNTVDVSVSLGKR